MYVCVQTLITHPRAGYGVDGLSRTVESSWADSAKGESSFITEGSRKTIGARELSGSLENGEGKGRG